MYNLMKTQQCGFRTGLTQTELHKHRSRLEARNFGFKKKGKCTACVAKTKVLTSFAVTAKVICVFVFAYADCWFSHEADHLLKNSFGFMNLLGRNQMELERTQFGIVMFITPK